LLHLQQIYSKISPSGCSACPARWLAELPVRTLFRAAALRPVFAESASVLDTSSAANPVLERNPIMLISQFYNGNYRNVTGAPHRAIARLLIVR
jgi:hypothetical protein